jgi:hypothetical protein
MLQYVLLIKLSLRLDIFFNPKYNDYEQLKKFNSIMFDQFIRF